MNSPEPLISVGIPTYNRPEGLQRTLECVTGQTYRNLEIIVSDNASPDPKVREVIESFAKRDPRVRHYTQSENCGALNNFRFAIEHAIGDFFMWAADDDEINLEYVAHLVDSLLNHSEAVLAYGILEARNTKTRETASYPNISILSGHKDTYQRMRAFLWAEESEGKANLFYALFRRSALLAAFNEIHSGWGADYLMIFHISTLGELIQNPKAVLTKGLDPDVRYDNPDPMEHHSEIQTYFQNYRNRVQACGLSLAEKALLMSEISIREALWYIRCPMWPQLTGGIKRLSEEVISTQPAEPPAVAMEVQDTQKQKSDEKSRKLALKAERLRMKRFYQTFLRKGELCFDIGANRGNRTEIFLSIGCRVVAVEPQRQCIDALIKQFADHPDFVLEPVALSSRSGKAEMMICEADTISSLSNEWIANVKKSARFAGLEWTKTETVKTTTLDKLIKKHGTPIFCKIDVEGFELSVLQGLTRAITFLSFEFTPEHLTPALACIDHLSSLGYAKFNFSQGETLKMQYPNWLTSRQIKSKMEQMSLNGSNVLFGDIYVKYPFEILKRSARKRYHQILHRG